MRYLGVDYGTKRIGIALSDEMGMMAFPKVVLENNERFWAFFEDMVKKWKVEAVVLGESRNFKGGENPVHAESMRFKEKIEKNLKLSVYLEPEYFTSAEAERIQGKIANLDASAAALILKSYLDRHHG